MLSLPYVSQLEPGALEHHNDCVIACGAMFLKGYKNLDITVDKLYNEVKPSGDTFLGAATHLMPVLYKYGLKTTYKTGMTLGNLYETLIEKKPLIFIIDYGVLVDAKLTEKKNFRGQHCVAGVGCDLKNIYIHDPYWHSEGGKNRPVPIKVFMECWKKAVPSCMAVFPLWGLGESEPTYKKGQVTPKVGLNVRTYPGGVKITAIPYRSEVLIESETAEWSFIISPVRGWVKSEFLLRS